MSSLGDPRQSGNMAPLLNPLFLVFKNSLLPNYRVKYYDYIVKWCSGIACNWCASLDIAYFSTLTCRIDVVLFIPVDPSSFSFFQSFHSSIYQV